MVTPEEFANLRILQERIDAWVSISMHQRAPKTTFAAREAGEVTAGLLLLQRQEPARLLMRGVVRTQVAPGPAPAQRIPPAKSVHIVFFRQPGAGLRWTDASLRPTGLRLGPARLEISVNARSVIGKRIPHP
jgi:hypothetical protein